MAEALTKARPARNRSRPRDGGRGPRPAPRPARAMLWALPPVALLALFFLYPLVLVVQQSFQPDGGGTSLQPYADVFASAAFRHALWTKKELKQAPRTWDELLDGTYRNKLQYSTPGVAGDGTAVLVKAIHDFGGKEQALAYLKKLQANNVGPSASTGKLAPKVDKGELLVANGDVQMNYAQSKDMPNLGIWFPAGKDGRATTFALPYAAGLVTKAPHGGNGRKLLDFMLSRQAQQQVSSVGGGFSARQDVKATDADAAALAKLMDGVDVFEPDWNDIDTNLTAYVEDWKSATGS